MSNHNIRLVDEGAKYLPDEDEIYNVLTKEVQAGWTPREEASRRDAIPSPLETPIVPHIITPKRKPGAE